MPDTMLSRAICVIVFFGAVALAVGPTPLVLISLGILGGFYVLFGQPATAPAPPKKVESSTAPQVTGSQPRGPSGGEAEGGAAE